jgi:hypothetical protein
MMRPVTAASSLMLQRIGKWQEIPKVQVTIPHRSRRLRSDFLASRVT